MENNKITISLNTVIIIVVIIGALILGLISYFIYDNMNKEANNSFIVENDNNKQSESIFEDNNNDEDRDITDNNSQIIDNSQKPSNTTEDEETTNSSTPSEPATNSSTPSEPTTNSVTGEPSSKQNPASIGEWSIASKIAPGGYVDVPVKVTNVTRGSSAEQEVKDYCNKGTSIYKYSEPKDGMEWAVIEYQVDLTKMEKNITAEMDTGITGTGDHTLVKYNGYTYIVSTMNMTYSYTKGEIVTCKFATTLPIGCTDYLIEIGSSSGLQAYFNGK